MYFLYKQKSHQNTHELKHGKNNKQFLQFFSVISVLSLLQAERVLKYTDKESTVSALPVIVNVISVLSSLQAKTALQYA